MTSFIVSTGVFAQEEMDDKMSTSSHKMDKMNGKMQDCVMMHDGKMMVMKGGSIMAMDEDMTMTNGTMVMTDGKVKMQNGKTMMLKNGQCMYMNGNDNDENG